MTRKALRQIIADLIQDTPCCGMEEAWVGCADAEETADKILAKLKTIYGLEYLLR